MAARRIAGALQPLGARLLEGLPGARASPALVWRPASVVLGRWAAPALAGRRLVAAEAGAESSAAELDKRRKRLLWRAKSRGWLELDVLMGTFTERHVFSYNDPELDLLEEVLELENPDLFKWFTGQVPVPEEIRSNKVLVQMLEFVKSDHKDGFSMK